MGLITDEVEIGLNPSNIKRFKRLGYSIPRINDKQNRTRTPEGTKLLVRVEDLADNSKSLVDVECDGCGTILKNIRWYSYKKYVKKDGKYYCQRCANNGYKKWVSFYDWCYENLSKEDADTIMLRWDYEKNIDKNGNVLSPTDVTYSSMGLNKKGYWFKCLDYPEHKSEQKLFNVFIRNKNRSLNCTQCNTIAITHPYLLSFIVNKNDALNNSIGTANKIEFKCQDCGFKKNMKPWDFIRDGFSCPRCSDGKSYPEKFMFNLLEQLLIKDFVVQLSKTTFKWCENYKYDFYINNIKCIIETHGGQHYEEKNTGWFDLQNIQENDDKKEKLAKENGVHNYIILDCRRSELEWNKNSIINSELPILLSFKEDDIDWLKCHEAGCKNIVKLVCDLWNKGIKNTTDIANELKIGRNTTNSYLKQGAELGWCDYVGKEVAQNHLISMSENNCKQVICLTTKEVFNSMLEAKAKYNLKGGSISGCCRKIHKSSGKLPDGTKLKWMYYEEYLQTINN